MHKLSKTLNLFTFYYLQNKHGLFRKFTCINNRQQISFCFIYVHVKTSYRIEFARGIYRREMFIPRRFRQQRSEEIHTKQAAFSLKRVKMWGIRMVKVDSSGIAGKMVNTRMRRDHCVVASPAFTLGLSYLLRGQEVFLFRISTVRLSISHPTFHLLIILHSHFFVKPVCTESD